MKNIVLLIFIFCFLDCKGEIFADSTLKRFTLAIDIGGLRTLNPSKNYIDDDITSIVAISTKNEVQGSYNFSLSYSLTKDIGIFFINKNYDYELPYDPPGGLDILYLNKYPFNFDKAYPNYYVFDLINDFSGYGYHQTNLLAGGYYDFIWKRLFIEPHLSCGIGIFKPPYEDIGLKEMGSNYTKVINFEGVRTYNPILSLGSKLGYKVNRFQFYLNFELEFYKLDIKYLVKSVDVFGKEEDINIDRKEQFNMHLITFGMSYSFNVLKHQQKKSKFQIPH